MGVGGGCSRERWVAWWKLEDLKALEGVCVFVIWELGVFEMVAVHLRPGHERRGRWRG